MAEAIFRSLASRALGCAEEKLRQHDVDILSAGVAAADNLPASSHAIQILERRGIDLSQHLSRQVTHEMLDKSDHIFAMTPGHLDVLMQARPDLQGRMRLLKDDGAGISDPIGGTMADYQHCASEITDCLQFIVEELFAKDTDEQ